MGGCEGLLWLSPLAPTKLLDYLITTTLAGGQAGYALDCKSM